MTDSRPGERPVKSHLERLIGRYGREEQLAVGRVRRWVSTMVLLGAFEHVQDDGGPRFVLTGGVVIELRLRAGARATQDVDVIFRGPLNELIGALDEALSTPYHDFAFHRGEPIRRGPHATGFDCDSSTSPGPGRPSASSSPVPMSATARSSSCPRSNSSTSFSPGRGRSRACRCGFRSPRRSTPSPNDPQTARIAASAISLTCSSCAIASTISPRSATPAPRPSIAVPPRGPPRLVVPDTWHDGYRLLANEIGLDVDDAEEAATDVRALIARIADA